ncbi:MAG: hypothetical protein IPK32_21685 [Verrucomicrobiaceae bacterium]|nr:hypothetical protein [Verrucomicrobiaceae bacterium]
MNTTPETLEGYKLALVSLAAFAPFVLSFISSLKGKGPTNVSDFFLFERNLDTGSYATGSVGYSMQVASIYLFLYWFSLYGWLSLIVPIAWFGGYLIQAYMVKKGKLDGFLSQDANAGTIHGYIVPEKSGLGRVAVCLLAVASLVGFAGTMLAEIDYALAYFVLPGMELSITDFSAKMVLYMVVLTTAGAYIMWGGYRAAIETDTFQVKWAFALFAAIIVAIGWVAVTKGTWVSPASCGFGLLAFSILAIWLRKRLKRLDLNYQTLNADRVMFAIIGILGGILLIGAISHRNSGVPTSSFADYLHPTQSFGWLGILSLFATNALWQFIDVSSLQRLQSLNFVLKKSEAKADLEANQHVRDRVFRGIISAGVEGTGSWFMVIALALVISACNIDPNKPHEAIGNVLPMWLCMPAFLYVVVAFMLSTLDTLVAASAFVIFHDIIPESRTNSSIPEERRMSAARRYTLAGIIVTGCVYVALKLITQSDETKQSQLVYAIYAIQAAICGPVIFAIIGKPLRPLGSILATILGASVALVIAAGWNAPEATWPYWLQESWYVLPPFASLAVSGMTALIFSLTARSERKRT